MISRPLRWVFGLALAAYDAVAAWLVWRTSILEPYSDMYDWIARWRMLQADHHLGRYLWAPHNFHHLVWTFTVLDFDIRAFGGHSDLFLAVGVACLAAIAAMLGALGAAAAGRGLRLLGGGVAVALALMGCDVLDASADINTTYLHALIFAVAAILLAEGEGPRPWLRRGVALVCALAAGLGSAAGLAVWPALLWGAWRRGDRGWLLAAGATAAAFSLLYLLGEAAPAGPAGGPQGLERLAVSTALFVNYLGLPWVRAIPALGWVMGLVVLGLSLAALATKGGRSALPPERTATALIVFSLATAVMAGIARTDATAPNLVPMRYAAFLSPLHVGLWVLALPYLRGAFQRRPGLLPGFVAATAAALLLHQAAMAVYAVRTGDMILRIVADFREGRQTPAMLTTISSDLTRAHAYRDQLVREGRYQTELRRDPPPGP